jgi:transposase-like protein
VRLAQTSGKPITHVARELGISDTRVQQWRKELAEYGHEAFPGSEHQTALEEENLYWLLGSSVLKQARRDGERSPSPACKQRLVGIQSDVVNSILMLERQYSQVMEKLLV